MGLRIIAPEMSTSIKPFMKELQNYVADVKSKAQSYPERREKQKSIIDKTIQAIRELFCRTKEVDSRALTKERKAIRAKNEPEEITEIEKISGGKYSFLLHQECKGKADRTIEDIEQKQKLRSKEKLSPMKNAERKMMRASKALFYRQWKSVIWFR